MNATAPIPTLSLTQRELDALPEYSTSLPTGTTIGKMWKRNLLVALGLRLRPHWIIGEYYERDDINTKIRWYDVELVTVGVAANPAPTDTAGESRDTVQRIVSNYSRALQREAETLNSLGRIAIAVGLDPEIATLSQLETAVGETVKALQATKQSPPEQIVLGDLIVQLRSRDPRQHVTFDFDGSSPKTLSSYRGYCEQLAICYGPDRTCTVDALLVVLRNAYTQYFEGYKGGSYSMRDGTPVWASNWGDASNRAVIGIDLSILDRVVLTTHLAEW